jgi:serine/threonine protein kinase
MRYISNFLTLSSKKYDYKNIIAHNKTYYKVEYLDPKNKKSKGGNSSVFKLINPNNQQEFVIKFLKFPSNSTKPFDIKQNIRFENEINALYEANSNQFQNVINIFFDGVKKISGTEFRYYVMQKANYDLNSYLTKETIPLNQKILLSYEILKGINELHSIDLYHRDIKPDNIFIFIENDKFKYKIGDLGLSVKGNRDLSKIEFREKIGPYGWLSPEVTNKVLCEGTNLEKIYDCKIDCKSDVFQLGKLIWFIFQGNIPIGQIRYSDFQIKDKNIYSLILNMIQYKKTRRKELNYFVNEFSQLAS